ncbi:hypothetical protein AVEN_260924-1, partial [Araneus ventricosus]
MYLVPSDCRDRPGRFPAYHSRAGGTFQVEFALALWIENISDAKISPEVAEGRALPSFASLSATSLPRTPTWEGIHRMQTLLFCTGSDCRHISASVQFPIPRMEGYKTLGVLSNISPISLALTLSVILIAIVFLVLKRRNLPPGPTGLPYLGYWPFLNNENITDKMEELKKKYGDVFSLTITGRLFIHLGSNKAVREAHISKAECFDGRLPYFSFLEQFFENGIGFAKGKRWKVLRKFFMTVLRKRASMLGEKSVINTVYDSIKSIVNDLREEKGKPVNLIQFLTHKCTANLRLMLFGEVGASEEQIRRITELHAEELGAMIPLNLLLSGPLA